MMTEKIDTRYRVETPEGIDLEASMAGPVPRVLAYLLDLAIRFTAILVIFIVLAVLGEAGMGIFLFLVFMVEWFYPVYFEVMRGGQTPGKQVFNIVVVNDDLTPVTWNSSIIRNLLRTADFLPFMYLGGIIAMVVTPGFRRLGDLAAGTLVIYKDMQRPQKPLSKVVGRAPDFPLEAEDQIAVIGFSQRHGDISAERQKELADILAPVTSVTGDEAVGRLHGIGNWLLGDRD
ncbi:RDD family protein [Pseudomaricurvus sp. HS19]|uniref:RDD family protein n=1 Tax=Pseudomaricurvus sp. HS19 TaxID=2692626 RepID=UPI00136B92BB|nr:RDD family protein [Pseudomaricurvus sp. HS19]MYM62948.1 RDD family protein [Pseudomaricurvus sp. HS19]